MEKMLNINGNLAIAQGERRIIAISAAKKPEAIALRVAAYARVSTSSDEQFNSYAAQNRYYTDLITAHDGWKLVDIYADEGISGTVADKRDDFQRLMADCRRGLIDRVLTKSIARFARNTVDCLEAVRELKSIGVSVFFEKEKIDTAIMSSEMITAIMASLAQKESESIGSNMQWSYQKRMERGEFNTCKAPFGFRLEESNLVVEESEACVVRFIFEQYLSGASREEIAAKLREANAPTRADVPLWKSSTIYHILSNERYAGNALLAKRITTNTFPKEKVKNHGERPQYYVEGSNPPIITPETFEKARQLAARRTCHSNADFNEHAFQKRLVCGCCGSVFKRQKPRNTEYWICYTHYESKNKCAMPSVTTAALQDSFCRMYYKLKQQGNTILSELITGYLTVKSQRMLWSLDVIDLNKKIADLTNQNQLLSALKQQGLVDSDIFISRSNAIAEQLRRAKQEKSRILEAEGDSTVQQTQDMIDILADGPTFLEEFRADLFHALVDKIIVVDADHVSFRMKNGLQFKEKIERRKR